MAYDALDRMTSQYEPFGAALTSIGYNAAGDRTMVQDSFSGTTTYTYDALHRLATIQFNATGESPLRADLQYNQQDLLTTITRYSDVAGSNKVGISVYQYDPGMRLTTIQHESGTGSLLVSMVYSYDAASRVASQTIASASTNYSYDALDQLTTVTTGSGTTTYGYDNNGNRNGPGYGVGSNNQMTSDGTWSYTYDAEGNVTQKQNPVTGETWHYSYDNLNELTGVTDVQSGSTVMQATYVYDAFGNRIEKDVWTQSAGTTTVTRFAYDGAQIWAQMDGTNALQNRYIHGDDQSPLLARESSTGTVGWYLTDSKNSVTNISDSSGTIRDTVTYDAYGNFSESNPSYGDQFKYTGAQYDGETGLQYHGARYYDPRTGRWFSQDPLGFAANDPNLYRYAGNGPTNGVDPAGLAQKPAHGLSGPAARIHVVSDTDPELTGNGPAGAQMDPQSAGTGEPWWARGLARGAQAIGLNIGGALNDKDFLTRANNLWGGATSRFGGGLLARLPGLIGADGTIDPTSPYFKIGVQVGQIAEILAQFNPATNALLGGVSLGSGIMDLVDAIRVGDKDGALQAAKGLGMALLGAVSGPCSSLSKFMTATSVVTLIQSGWGKIANGQYLDGILDLIQGILEAQRLRDSCFPAGTPLLTPDGERPIEELRPGDWILSAPDDDPLQPPEPKQIEETFATSGRLISLHVGERTIRTTVLHRFYVRGKGWINAKHIQPGDALRAHDGAWLVAQAVNDPTDHEEPVYNLIVSKYHTYFVGARAWGLAVWAHNGAPCKTAKEGEQAPLTAAQKERARNIARGIPESALGPSGKPKRHFPQYPSRKRAKEAAQREGGGKPINNPHDTGQPPHFHAATPDGEKLKNFSVHYYYPAGHQ